MNRNPFKHIKPIRLLPLLFAFYSCVDKEISIQDTVFFAPEYSLPVGQIEVILEDVIADYGSLDSLPSQDSIPDSIAVFIYDQIAYYSPTVFTRSTDVGFDFSSISSELERVTSLVFRSNCINEVPGQVRLQVYFLDAGHIILDSLYKNELFTIEAATTDTNGYVTQGAELWKHDTKLDSNDIMKLEPAKHIRITTELNVENLIGKKINYYPEQKFWFQLGLKVKLDLPLHELN